MTATLAELIGTHQIQVDDHLARDLHIPILTGLQRQGDVLVIPRPGTRHATTPVPAAGTPVVRGENGGNTHAIVGTGNLCDRSRAYEDAQSAGWWWPFREFVMVCDAPTELHVEQIRPAGWGSHRLHCETGPAVAWADGWGLYAWHGVQVPESLIVHGWDTSRILQEPNTEVRRCAIERLGWDCFIVDAGLAQVGTTVADPGNPGHDLALFDVPRRIYDAPVRVLLCSNATPERDGTRRRFGLIVPASIPDPISAAAWTFGVDPADYRNLQRAS